MLGFSPSELASESVAGWGADGEGVDGKGNIVGRFLSLGNGSCAGECCWVAGRFWGKGKCSDFGVDGKGNIVGRFLSLGNGSCAGECCWVAGRFWGKGKCSDFGVVAFK